ncbi:MAG: phosphonate ABC transporter, permease protein PhnE [Microbacterium sp.]
MSTATRTARPVRPRQKWWVTLLQVGLFVLFVVALSGLVPNWSRLVEAPATAWRYFQLMVGGVLQNPFVDPVSGQWTEALTQMVVALAMAWIGTLIAAIISLPLAFIAAFNLAPRPVVAVTRLFLDLMRAIPDVLFAIVIFMPLYGLGPVAGAFALGVGSIGSLGKLTSEVIEAMPSQTLESVRATGARPLQVIRWGVLPQVMPEIVAFWLYRFEINIRAGGILGAIGAGGIGALLLTLFQDRDWDQIGIALVVIIVITVIADQISATVRHRLIAGSHAPKVA